jgi:hypothetical protein
MFESKKDGINLYVAPTKLVGDVAISLSFPMIVDGCALSKLGRNGSCDSKCFPVGSEEAALCYALYMVVEQVLAGDPLAVSKSKVGKVSCGAHNDMFFINWNTKGTVSAARKSIGLALRSLNPGKLNSIYSRLIRDIGGVPKRESFAYVASNAAKAINSNLTIGIVGNINVDKKKIDDMLEVLAKKKNVSDITDSKSKPSDHSKCDHTHYTEVKVSGWESAALSDYLKFKVKGLNPVLCNNNLIINMKKSNWESAIKKLKLFVKDYAESKFGRVKADLPQIFAYLTIANASLCANDAKEAITKKLTPEMVKSAIEKHLA